MSTSAAVVDHVILYYFYPAILPVVRRWSSYPHRLMIPPHPSRHEAQANHVSQDAQPLPDPDVAVLLQARCLGGDFGGTDLRISSIDILGRNSARVSTAVKSWVLEMLSGPYVGHHRNASSCHRRRGRLY